MKQGEKRMAKYLSPENIAEKLDLHINTVRRYLREGKIPAIKLDRIYKIDEKDFEYWLEEKKQATKR